MLCACYLQSPSIMVNAAQRPGKVRRLQGDDKRRRGSTGHVQSRVVAGQPSPPSPLSLNGRGGAERILMKKRPSPREGEGQGVRGPELTLLMP